MVAMVLPAVVVVVEPPGTVVVEASVGTVVEAGEVVVVFAVLGRRDGPPAAVVVGASLPVTTAGEVDVGLAVAPVAVPVVGVVVVVVVFFGSDVTHWRLN